MVNRGASYYDTVNDELWVIRTHPVSLEIVIEVLRYYPLLDEVITEVFRGDAVKKGFTSEEYIKSQYEFLGVGPLSRSFVLSVFQERHPYGHHIRK